MCVCVVAVKLASGRTHLALSAHPHPHPLAIQLSLKDSSCAMLGPCTQRSHCCSPGVSCEPAVTAQCCTLVGNFKQTSSKAGRFTLRNTQEAVNVPRALWKWATVLYMRPSGPHWNQPHSWWLFRVFVRSPRVFRGALVDKWSPVLGRVHVGWDNHCLNSFTVLCFAAALFEECPVTRRACAGHTSHEFYRLGMRHSAIIKARVAEWWRSEDQMS